MTHPKAHTPPKPMVVGPKSATGIVAMMSETVPSQDRIRERAYELYEKRGREPGQEEHDWLRAEQEILKKNW